MKTYAQIQAEIARLERQAEAARKAEIAGVVGRIKEAIAAYGLTARDLGFGGGKPAAAPASAGPGAQSRTAAGVPKYRDPATGRTWTGRGKPPGWIAAATDRDEFLVAAERAPSDGRRRGGKGTKAASAGRRPASTRKASAAPAQSESAQIVPDAASQ